MNPDFSLSIRLERNDEIPAFGAFLRCEEQHDGSPVILLNVNACLSPSLEDENGAAIPQTPDERKRIVISTLMHEFGHALESHFKLPVNEEAIEKAVQDWEAAHTAQPAIILSHGGEDYAKMRIQLAIEQKASLAGPFAEAFPFPVEPLTVESLKRTLERYKEIQEYKSVEYPLTLLPIVENVPVCSVCTNHAPQNPHPCPYLKAVSRDFESLCNCCKECEENCSIKTDL